MAKEISESLPRPGPSAFDVEVFAGESYIVTLLREMNNNGKAIRINKFRDDPQLTAQNIKVESIIARGGFGYVFKVLNTDTNIHYAMKLQTISEDVNAKSPERLSPPTVSEAGSFNTLNMTPPITPSSQATFRSQPMLSQQSLRAKRHQETKVYLRYVKEGHPNICMLEAFVDYEETSFDHPQNQVLIMAQWYELADVGTVLQLMQRYRDEGTHPPEGFIWHVYSQIFEALAFLHNEHPHYNTKPLHANRPCILHYDLHYNNIFLKWGASKDQYPDIKIGDLGIAKIVPIGGYAREAPNYHVTGSNWPESDENQYTTKIDVWRGGTIVYQLAKSGHRPVPYMAPYLAHRDPKTTNESIWRAAKYDRRRVRDIASHYSAELNNSIKRCLAINKGERPSAGQWMQEVNALKNKRGKYMYRRLPDWVGTGTSKHEFPDGRIDELVAPGGYEAEHEQRKQERAERQAQIDAEGARLDAEEAAKQAERKRRRLAGESYSAETEYSDWGTPLPKGPRIPATGVPIVEDEDEEDEDEDE